MIEILEQLPASMILLGDFNVHNPLWGSEKMSTRGRMIEKVLNKKEETYYRAFDSRKSIIDLIIASLAIARNLNGAKNKNSGEVIISPSS